MLGCAHGSLSSWTVVSVSGRGFSGIHVVFFPTHMLQESSTGIKYRGIRIRRTASKTDEQRALVSPQVGKSSMFGYPVYKWT